MTSTLLGRLMASPPTKTVGRVVEAAGLEIHVSGIDAAIGDVVFLEDGPPAQVLAIRDSGVVVTPLGSLAGITKGMRVAHGRTGAQLPVGPGLRGRVVDGLGEPIDGRGPLASDALVDVDLDRHNPLERQRISESLSLGVRAIDTLLTCGTGQRVGIFAGAGVGKSSLLGMIARGCTADVVVVGLIGERGREVREFLEDDLGNALDRSVVIVSTSDEPAAVRLRAAFTATRIAEWFAAQGNDVLLLVDSLTRVATAQRELGLTAGEPPTTRGHPPSVFSMLPRLLERAGPLPRGSITGLYTVLVEGDDPTEPIADHARSLLDGHIVLSRRLASMGHFPTIDVLESASRLATKITEPDQQATAAALRRLLVAWEEGRDLVEVGAYSPGTAPDLDRYLERRDRIDAFLRQGLDERSDASLAWEQLREVVDG